LESVRDATSDDLAVVVALAEAFVTEQHAQRGGVVWAAQEGAALRHADDLAASIDDPRHLVLLGCIDDVEVALLLAHLEALPDDTTLAVVRCLYVDRDAREVGVGSALLAATVDWARRHRCRGIDAEVLPGNRDGKNFFEMHGLVARAIRVHRRLDDA
jgi:GNAT superfamily N-acetyltransferase